MRYFFARIFIVFGSLCIIYALYLVYLRYNTNRLSFINPPAAIHKKTTSYTPILLSIPSLSLKLPIIPATITNSTWETTDNGVSYLRSSALPGEDGNSIFYGHNYESILGPLTHIKKGDRIEIMLSNNKKVVYKVSYLQTVTSDATHILEQTSDKRLTLYTCSGFLDSRRFVVIAIPA